MKRAVVFASGSGSNFQALLDHRAAGDLHVDFSACIGNNSKAVALDRARKSGIPTIHLAPSAFADPAEYSRQLTALLDTYNPDMLALAGYMKKLPAEIVARYRHRIVNIHPALLPSFGGPGMYGHFVHDAVIASGAKLSGVTVHFVDEEYDHGPIILQQTVPVLDTDTPETLAARVLTLEHASYWRALEALAQERISVVNGRVRGQV